MFHNIHDVFHISLLKPYKIIKSQALFLLSLIELEDEEHVEVKEIFDSRVYYSKLQYLVKWLGFLVTDNKWLKAEKLSIVKEYVTNFHKKYPKKPSPDNLHWEKQ